MKRSPKSTRPAERGWQGGLSLRRLGLVFTMLFVLVAVPRVMQLLVPAFAVRSAIAITAWLSALLISCAGVPVELAGNRIEMTNHILRIDPGCTPIVWLGLYTFAVLLMPVTFARKRHGLLIGWPVLISFNFARIVAAALVSEWQPGQFLFVHDVLLQSLFTGLTVAVWALWVRSSSNDWLPGWR